MQPVWWEVWRFHELAIPVILCIDAEPDKPFNHRADPLPWRGYQRAVAFFAGFRAKLETLSAAEVHLSWFYRMDPQIEQIHGDAGWAISSYTAEIEGLRRAGDELGLHTHPFRWDEKADTWLQDYGNQSWIEHSLHMAFDTFRRELGRDCVSFRFGDRWMNEPSFQLLERLGVRYDLTLEPGSKRLPSYHPRKPHTGFIPDQRGVPRSIYRPAKSDYQQRDDSRLDGPLIIPVSTAPIHLESGKVYEEPALHERLLYRLTDPARIRNWCQPLSIASPPTIFRSVLEYNLGTLDSPYLALVARSHIFTSEEFIANVRANLVSLFDYQDRAGGRDFVFATPAEAVAQLGFAVTH